ncbi:MAG: Clp1/GlmU family protein [Aigarchaeota archaeon]|nr:Clp1/GlmU family protein [Aigarchaeota archaeon]MCX8192674.1 Clp1/GlmU family protein [Nitrososphaeria archaeon]MDW7985633.1 Clp1/GlmU family protein [Nitrososphaerota archaeon]
MPIHTLKAGRTLIVNGPASIRLLEGRASILACPLTLKKQIVVKSWRSRPVYAHEDSDIEYAFGEGGSIEEVEGNTIPLEWIKTVEDLSNEEKLTLMVLGSSDSGKTSLATLAINTILVKRRGCVFLDLDVGQSSICPPTTIGYVYMKNPIPDISYMRAESTEVVGYTSPSPILSKHITSIEKLYNALKSKYPDQHIVVDVDGWVSGEGAAQHKKELVKMLNITHLLILGEVPRELEEPFSEGSVEIKKLPPPIMVRKRSLDARKRLREMMYEKFLRKSMLKTIPISWVEVKYVTGEGRVQKISSIINKLIRLFSEDKNIVVENGLEEVSRMFKAGILSYIYDVNYRYSGIGLMTLFDLKKNLLKIYTPFRSQVKQIVLSSILVSIDGSELYSIRPQALEP